jgi:hypothetical protein
MPELSEKFDLITNDGLFPVVAYSPLFREKESTKFSVLTSNIPDLSHALDIFKEAIGRDYNLGQNVDLADLQNLVAHNPHLFRLQEVTIQEAISPTDVRDVAMRFGPSYWPVRGFALVDICGFSTLQPRDQLAHLLSLDNMLRSAARRCGSICAALNVETVFSRSSTGDGYYIWHKQLGIPADIAVFSLLVAIMTQSEAMRSRKLFPMRLKGAFAVGEVFTFFDRLSSESEHLTGENAVGPVTNDLARLISVCRPSQILVKDFDRPGSLGNMTPSTMIAQTGALYSAEHGRECNLRFDPESPSPPFRIRDKHGNLHHCWNLTGEIYNQFSRSELPAPQRIGLKPDLAKDVEQYSFKGDI